jgi:hypothetical protein
LQVGWSAASTILLLAILAGSVQLNWRRRRWGRGNMAGVPVHISEDAGPAMVGLLDPHIVVPRWLMQCPPDVQELVIAHEQGHLDAHDARLVTIALGLLVRMPWNLPRDGGGACLGIAFAVGAAEISPPNADDAGKSASEESAADTETLAGYLGFYQLNDDTVLTITGNRQQLNAQLTGQPEVPIHARSNTEFSYKDAQISFATEPDGQTTSLILHQHGVDMPMKRIDAATARRIASTHGRPGRRPGRFVGGALVIRR